MLLYTCHRLHPNTSHLFASSKVLVVAEQTPILPRKRQPNLVRLLKIKNSATVHINICTQYSYNTFPVAASSESSAVSQISNQYTSPLHRPHPPRLRREAHRVNSCWLRSFPPAAADADGPRRQHEPQHIAVWRTPFVAAASRVGTSVSSTHGSSHRHERPIVVANAYTQYKHVVTQ